MTRQSKESKKGTTTRNQPSPQSHAIPHQRSTVSTRSHEKTHERSHQNDHHTSERR